MEDARNAEERLDIFIFRKNDHFINAVDTINWKAGKMGKTVTQVIEFKGGIRKTIPGVLTATIENGVFTKFMVEDGRMFMINDSNVLCIEIFKEEKWKKPLREKKKNFIIGKTG